MKRLFLDSSALAKRYVKESGTERVLALLSNADEVLLSVLAVPELISAFNRLRREKKISHGQYLSLKNSLAADIPQATLIDISTAVIECAVRSLEEAPLRTLDALHIGSAIISSADLFVSADARQCESAEAMHLKVEHVGEQA
ncbi:MAG: type II toxin-antitoxin system VapC family toxin [Candidatus Eremiobacteraeota bacterium]|nr:type II toxin-antitoxin system VapC family toxin [Candidatus Eremiobacteraeota bacterium]